MDPDFTLPVIRTRQAILDTGLCDNEIRHALAAGTLVRIRRGCYGDGVPADGEGTQAGKASGERGSETLAPRVAAAAIRLGDGHVFSHATAAALWGLPFLGDPSETIHVTVPRTAHGCRRAMVHQHPGALLPEEIVVRQGIRITGLARTLVDVARTEGFRPGVVMADHALRLSPDPEGLMGAMRVSIGRLKGASGIGEARRMALFATGAAESPGESLSRIVLSEQHVPIPQLQYRLTLSMPGGRRQTYRTDFAWERQKVIGEFDGRTKYERYRRRGETPGDVVFREKVREDAIRAAGWLVVRWTWEDLTRPDQLGRRLRDVLASRS